MKSENVINIELDLAIERCRLCNSTIEFARAHSGSSKSQFYIAPGEGRRFAS